MNLLNHRYQILEPLSSGGFGDTYLAVDTQMPSRRKCVIKQLKPVTHNPQIYQVIQDRFKREAAILEKLGNGNNQIPQLYAYFEENGQFYLVQEWIEGETLSDKILKQGVFDVSTVQSILREILPVIDYIHQQKIIHRDIKPGNIIIRNHDEKPVLIDFGAVKETMGTTVVNSGETASTIIIGTPGYMSAEQGIGRPVYSSDLYALGLTAIYLLTGTSPQNLNTNLQTGEIEWVNPDINIDPNFQKILNKSICYNFNDRYHTAQEMLQELSSLAQINPPQLSLPISHQKTTLINPVLTEKSLETTHLLNPNTVILTDLKNWQKILIISTIIGLFSFIAIILSRYIQFPINITLQTTENPSPSPISTPTFTPTPIPKISPEEAVINYYNYINQNQYEKGWNQLSIEHQTDKNRHPKGYQSYLEWWTSVKLVTITSVKLIRENDDYALVETELHYEMKEGRPFDQKLNFHLLWDESSQIWSINWVDRIYTKYL